MDDGFLFVVDYKEKGYVFILKDRFKSYLIKRYKFTKPVTASDNNLFIIKAGSIDKGLAIAAILERYWKGE